MGKTSKSLDLVTRSKLTRSRITNGAERLPGIDGRSAVARRYRDLCAALIGDAAGIERCSEARLQLIRRFAAVSVIAEAMEAKLANGEAIDIAEHCALSSTLVRLASRIGIDRRSKTLPTTLADYIEGRASEKRGEAA
jgi:hypothetical protein